MIRRGWKRGDAGCSSGIIVPVARDWLLITASTPAGATSHPARLRRAQSAQPRRPLPAAVRVPAAGDAEDHARREHPSPQTRLRAEGGHGEMLRISLTDSRQEAAVIDAMQRERTDEYREVVWSTREVPQGAGVRAPSRPGHVHRAPGILYRPRPPSEVARRDPRARELFTTRPGGEEAAAAVASCEEALALFESEALSAELDEPASDAGPGLHAVDKRRRLTTPT